MRRFIIIIFVFCIFNSSFADKAQLAEFLSGMDEKYTEKDFQRTEIPEVNYRGYIPVGWDYDIEPLAGVPSAMIFNKKSKRDEFLSIVNIKIYNKIKSEKIFNHYVDAIVSNIPDWKEKINMYTPEYNMIIGGYTEDSKEVYNIFASMEIAREMFLFIGACDKDRLKNGFYELFAKSFKDVYPINIYTLDGKISLKYKDGYIREKSREEETTLLSLAVINQSEKFTLEGNTLVDSVVVGGSIMPLGYNLKGLVDGNVDEIRKAFNGFKMIEEGERSIDGSKSNYILFKYKLQDMEIFSMQDYVIHNQSYYVIGYTQVINDVKKLKEKMSKLLSEIKFSKD